MSVRPAAPVIGTPLLRHWNPGGGSPEASTARTTASPIATSVPAGPERIAGAKGLASTVKARSAPRAGRNAASPPWDARPRTSPGAPVGLSFLQIGRAHV